MAIPVNIITGYLGSGKTTILMGLVRQMRVLDPSVRLALIKNEFGSAGLDGMLAGAAGVTLVKEYYNGCMCCNLVGSLSATLAELAQLDPPPTRVLIETSGSALPLPLAREVASQPAYILDSVVCVVDLLNFASISDTSRTAKLQASCTDLVVLNKWDLLLDACGGSKAEAERRVDEVLDDIFALMDAVPKVVAGAGGEVIADLVFGHSAGAGVWMAAAEAAAAAEGGADGGGAAQRHHAQEVESLSWVLEDAPAAVCEWTHAQLVSAVARLPADDVYRAKGVLRVRPDGCGEEPAAAVPSLWNWVRGRLAVEPLPSTCAPAAASATRAVFMGRELGRHARTICAAWRVQVTDASLDVAGSRASPLL